MEELPICPATGTWIIPDANNRDFIVTYAESFLICKLCSINTSLGRLPAGFQSDLKNTPRGEEVRAHGSLPAACTSVSISCFR
jgi:hypothetical protein